MPLQSIQRIRQLSGSAAWSTRAPSLIKRAVGLSEEAAIEPATAEEIEAPTTDPQLRHVRLHKPSIRLMSDLVCASMLMDCVCCSQEARKSATGAFQSIPIVPTSDEHLASALKRAGRIGPNSKLKNEAARAKNKTARQMDGENSCQLSHSTLVHEVHV